MIPFRIGHGFDVHAFGGEGPITLGGVKIDYPQGLLAHSDGDVVLHAVSDAILGALALGDIGHHFPDTDAAFKGIDSRILLRKVVADMQKLGFKPGNLDVTIMAQAPKMAPQFWRCAKCWRLICNASCSRSMSKPPPRKSRVLSVVKKVLRWKLWCCWCSQHDAAG